jgi:hypothetical protein
VKEQVEHEKTRKQFLDDDHLYLAHPKMYV